MPLFPPELRRLYRSDENVGIGESLSLIRFLQYSAIFSELPRAPLAARRLHRGLARGPTGLSRSGSPGRMRSSTASGSANELRKLPTTTRRKHEDESIPPAIQAFVDTCSDNRAHPGGSEHV